MGETFPKAHDFSVRKDEYRQTNERCKGALRDAEMRHGLDAQALSLVCLRQTDTFARSGGGSFWVFFFMVFLGYFLWFSVRCVRKSVSQSASRSAFRAVSQSVSGSANRAVRQSVSRFVQRQR